jgi:hypothetical protein
LKSRPPHTRSLTPWGSPEKWTRLTCFRGGFAEWPPTVERITDLLNLGEFAVAGWSAGGPHVLACAASSSQRARAAATLAGMAPAGRARDVLELGLGLWADRLLIPAVRWSVEAAAVMLWLGRKVPNRYLGWEIRRTAGSRDREALEAEALP